MNSSHHDSIFQSNGNTSNSPLTPVRLNNQPTVTVNISLINSTMAKGMNHPAGQHHAALASKRN